MSEFDKKRKGTGTKEWAEVNENITLGCPSGCLYCYAAANAANPRYGARKLRHDWTNEVLTKRAQMTSYPARDGIIMFPTTHEITPFNVAAYIRVALLMLKKGNRLLITTKARIDIMDAMTFAFGDYREQILFRITIGNMNSAVTDFWEPGAPPPIERLRALCLAQERGFQTSVSIEPMLGGMLSTLEVVNAVTPFTTETIWCGKMNKIKLRVDMQHPGVRDWVETLGALQRDQEIIGLYRALQGNPQIRWKDSIREVLVNHGVIAPEADQDANL